MFVWPIPAEQKLAELYSEGSGYQADMEIVDGWLSFCRRVRKIIHFLKAEKLTSQQANQLLDVGCSSGDFLVSVREAGFEVQGVELNPRKIGIRILSQYFAIPIHLLNHFPG